MVCPNREDSGSPSGGGDAHLYELLFSSLQIDETHLRLVSCCPLEFFPQSPHLQSGPERPSVISKSSLIQQLTHLLYSSSVLNPAGGHGSPINLNIAPAFKGIVFHGSQSNIP